MIEYIVTDSPKIVALEPFTTDPPGCSVRYNMGQNVASSAYIFDSSALELEIDYDFDLQLCGPDFIDHELTLTATTGIATTKIALAKITLRLINPCSNTDFVTVNSVPLPTAQ